MFRLGMIVLVILSFYLKSDFISVQSLLVNDLFVHIFGFFNFFSQLINAFNLQVEEVLLLSL